MAWQNIDRAMPYVGWVNSANGQVDVALQPKGQNINISTVVVANAQSKLPAGRYSAKLNIANHVLNVPSLRFDTATGSLQGQAKVNLPHDKQQLSWHAQLLANNFNPQLISPAAPVNLINGRVNANGYAKPNQHIIQLQGIDLKGRLAQNMPQPWIRLTGASTAALLFKPSNAGGGLQSYALRYDGGLNAFEQGAGALNIVVWYTNFSTMALREVFARGWLMFKNTLAWDLQTSLVRFKPQYFTSKIKVIVSTSTHWGCGPPSLSKLIFVN